MTGQENLVEEVQRLRAIEQRANLIAGMSRHDPDVRGHHRAAVFILTGDWPAGEKRRRHASGQGR